jgi:hypothetical protein
MDSKQQRVKKTFFRRIRKETIFDEDYVFEDYVTDAPHNVLESDDIVQIDTRTKDDSPICFNMHQSVFKKIVTNIDLIFDKMHVEFALKQVKKQYYKTQINNRIHII